MNRVHIKTTPLYIWICVSTNFDICDRSWDQSPVNSKKWLCNLVFWIQKIECAVAHVNPMLGYSGLFYDKNKKTEQTLNFWTTYWVCFRIFPLVLHWREYYFFLKKHFFENNLNLNIDISTELSEWLMH